MNEQTQSVMLASLRELAEAYLQAQRNRDRDELFWRARYCERLVMLCDAITDSSRVGGVDGHESERGGGFI